ncbi:anaphase-promoting complex subunit 3 [Kwoniella heveanensis BCC8398]|uniref:Anaphase-promoting complex subunit 3 n=1 Tax=Kwoniella heveanensis BCC8398 TaxID=1296120 RepID=A0A1B9H0K8_9TREE|nr:anaphase-promoting complex subunit 3 [Kwoniella heveanensis BCC8398]
MATSASGSGSASPSPTHLSRRLQQLSQSSTPTTALFYARLYHSFFPPRQEEHESLHTLALCFLQSGEPYSALHLVRDSAGVDEPDDAGRYRPFAHGLTGSGGKSAPCYGCAMIVARCCEKLGRFSEGQAVLSRALKRCTPTNLTIPSPASTSASAHLLLASLSHKGKAPEAAVDNYVRALQDDPWLWEAFTGLCDIGAAPSLESIFPDPPALSRASSARTSRPPTLSPNPMPRSSASEVPGLLPSRKTTAYGNGNGGGGGGFFTPDVGVGAGLKLGMMGNASSWDTPSAMGDTTFQTTHEQSSHPTSRRPLPNLLSTFMPSASHLLPASLRSSNASTPTNDLRPPKPPAMKRPRGKDGAKKTAEAPAAQLNGLNLPLARELRPNGHDRDLKSGPVRRSSRLKGSSTKPAPPKVTRPRNARSRSVTSSASGATVDISSSPSLDSQLQTSADDWLRDVVRKCARAYRYLGLYQCQEAMRELDGLPYEVKTSAWSLDILARSFYEMANYVVARRAFASLLELEPYRLQSMEQYSTLLWHISDPPALSHLSQSLMSVNRESPQPWIAAGNCFSLQKDHDEAMRCFRRATQLDPGCAYAWTLCGYEAMEMEEYERAIAFYRTAIRNDSRHYNAWYGMGLVYMKTGKTRYAEHHFRRAVDINPTNAVLLCCVGMVLEQSDDIVQAIHFYERAVAYAPNSPMVQFKRIRVLVALQRFDEAIALLEPLSREAPDEANIFFLLGKCYLRRDRRGEATVAFTTARELQPKLEGPIKATLEANGEEEEEEED